MSDKIKPYFEQFSLDYGNELSATATLLSGGLGYMGKRQKRQAEIKEIGEKRSYLEEQSLLSAKEVGSAGQEHIAGLQSGFGSSGASMTEGTPAMLLSQSLDQSIRQRETVLHKNDALQNKLKQRQEDLGWVGHDIMDVSDIAVSVLSKYLLGL